MQRHATPRANARDTVSLQALTLFHQVKRAAKKAPKGNLAIGPWRSHWEPAEGGKSHIRLTLAGTLTETRIAALIIAFAAGKVAVLRSETVRGETTLHFLTQSAAPIAIPVTESTDAAGNPTVVEIPVLRRIKQTCRRLNPEAWGL